MLRLSGIPAFVEGNIVHIPEGVFAIEAGCNGMHFFIVAVSIAALYGEIHGDLFKVRFRQVLLAAGIALASNWIRVYVVIVAGHLTDMQHYLIRVSHYYFGWAVFGVCMAAFFWLVSRTPARPLPTTAPVTHSKNSRDGLLAGALAALAVAGTGPVLGAFAPAGVSPSPHALLTAVPGWLGPEIESTSWQPVYPGSDRADSAGYRRAGTAISSYVAEYDDQRQGKELVGYGNSLLHGVDGTVTSREPVQLAGGEALSLEIAAHDGTRSVVAYFYEIGGSYRISGPGAQLTYAVKSIFRPTTSRVVAVQVMCADDCAAAKAAARQWLEDFAGSREL
jgi:EpsI family protein